MPTRLWLVTAFLTVCSLALGAKGGEDAVYVYEAFKDAPTCAEVTARLKKLPLRPTVILSIEQGPEFVLDRAGGEQLLACAITSLRRARPSHSVKALLLQDPSFLTATGDALRRMRLLARFNARHKKLLAGAQVDVEPYVTEKWSCCDVAERRVVMRSLHALLAQARRALRPLPLGVVAPWWYPAVSGDIPEAAPESLYAVADEIYLMAYGDEGGPLVGGAAGRILERLDAAPVFAGSGRMHIALATYEFESSARLDADLDELRRRLSGRKTFAGTAVFHAASVYNAPLARFVSGIVTDAQGKALAEVDIETAGLKARSSACGEFSIRGISGEISSLLIQKAGFRPRTLPIQPPAPGAVLDLGKITLEKETAPPAPPRP